MVLDRPRISGLTGLVFPLLPDPRVVSEQRGPRPLGTQSPQVQGCVGARHVEVCGEAQAFPPCVCGEVRACFSLERLGQV